MERPGLKISQWYHEVFDDLVHKMSKIAPNASLADEVDAIPSHRRPLKYDADRHHKLSQMLVCTALT